MKFIGNFFSLLTEFCKNCVKRTFDRAKSKKKRKKRKTIPSGCGSMDVESFKFLDTWTRQDRK